MMNKLINVMTVMGLGFGDGLLFRWNPSAWEIALGCTIGLVVGMYTWTWVTKE